MVNLTKLACFVAASLAVAVDAQDDAIVGGERVPDNQYPWMVSMARSGRHFCGGSLIAPNVVLTAAHCAVYSASQITARVKGSSTSNSSGFEQISVRSVIKNPAYVSSRYSGDIAVLILDRDSTIAPFAFDTGSGSTSEHAGKNAKVIGWGTLRQGGSTPTNLMGVTVPVVSNQECADRSYGSQIDAKMICGGFPAGGKDSCQGDSGGPWFIGDTIVGVVSWGQGCAQANKYGVYARVAETTNRAFIEKYAKSAGGPTEPPVPSPPTAAPTTPPPTATAPPTEEPPVPFCECNGGNGRFEICDLWYQEYKPTSDPLYNQSVCLLKYSGSARPNCRVPEGGELKFSQNFSNWYMNGCTVGRNVYVEPLEYNDSTLDIVSVEDPKVTPVDEKKPEVVAAEETDVMPLLAGAVLGTAFIVGGGSYAAHKRIVATTNKDEFNNFQVSNNAV